MTTAAPKTMVKTMQKSATIAKIVGLATSTMSFQMLNAYEPSMHRKYPIAVDRLQNEIRDLAKAHYSRNKIAVAE